MVKFDSRIVAETLIFQLDNFDYLWSKMTILLAVLTIQLVIYSLLWKMVKVD